MVLKAMYSGVSGLRAEGEALGVIGDNIANVNTVGFKSQRAIFQDVLGRSIMAGNSTLPGSGVAVGKIQQNFTQGSLSTTGISTDLALSGEGFFSVQGTIDGVTGNFFTRAGQFVINNDGYLVNPAGLEVQGYAANPDGTFEASMSAVQVPTSALQPNPSSELVVTANLDAEATVPIEDWDEQDPANTSNFSTSLTVYDSLGSAHTLDIYFRKTGDGLWSWYALASGNEIDGGTPDTNAAVGSGTLDFTVTTNGALNAITADPLVVDFLGATPGQEIALDFGNATGDGGTGLDGITQFAAASSVSSQSQNGYAAGDFTGISVDGEGVVTGIYTNGQKLAISQLAIAKFRCNDGLGRAGQGLWIDTRDSGPASYGTASSGGRGAISAGSVETSNVDLAEEFVGLIQHQRSFSANSKTITTADQMLEELINIKR